MIKLQLSLAKYLTIRLTLLALLCCTVGDITSATSPMIDITVVSAGSTAHSLNGVTLVGIQSDGKYVQLGKTDAVGHIHVSKRQLRDAGVTALIFCHRTYFCGALIVADRELLEYDEYLMALAPIAVR